MDALKEVVTRLKKERERLFVALQETPFLQPYPSQANFILCHVVDRDAAELKARLAQEDGILVRYFSKPGLSHHIRISVGRPQDTDILLKALNTI